MFFNLPLPIIIALIGAIYWPVTLAVAAVFMALGFVIPARWARVICFIVAAILAADCLLKPLLRL